MKLILLYFLHFIGIKTEGLFRVPGAKARIDMVRGGGGREGEREREGGSCQLLLSLGLL